LRNPLALQADRRAVRVEFFMTLGKIQPNRQTWSRALTRALLLCAIFAITPGTATSQIFYNNGAQIRVTPGGLVKVNGSATNNSGMIDNDGTTHVINNFTIGTTAQTRGLGTMYVGGNWTNNGTFTASLNNGDGDESTIIWNGTAQDYGGTSVTTFWNLTVTGGSNKTFYQNARLNHLCDFTNGWLKTTEANLITFNRTGQWTNATNNSHVDGPVGKEIDSAVEWHFPTGKQHRFNMCAVTPLSATFTNYRAEYFFQPYWNTTSVIAPLVAVSKVHYWHVDRLSGTANARIRLYWIPGDYIPSWLMDPADLVVARWTGAAWMSEGSSFYEGNWNAGDVRSANFVSTFITPNQPFTLGTITFDNPLPVELSYFKASQSGQYIDLNWKTEAEIENDGFEVERAAADGPPELIRSFKFDPELRGKSFFGAEYKTIDKPQAEGIYIYDLYQQDLNGIRTKVATKTVDYKFSSQGMPLNVEVYPNPTSTFTRAMFTLDRDQQIAVLIYDATGKQVAVAHEGLLLAGPQEIQLPVSQLANGAYTVTIITDQGRVSKSVIVSR
jgi:hypothetical protein